MTSYVVMSTNRFGTSNMFALNATFPITSLVFTTSKSWGQNDTSPSRSFSGSGTFARLVRKVGPVRRRLCRHWLSWSNLSNRKTHPTLYFGAMLKTLHHLLATLHLPATQRRPHLLSRELAVERQWTI